MRFTVLQDNLKRGLAVVSHAVAGKSTLPVLSNVLITASDGRVTLKATNLEIGITHAIGAMVEVDGGITLPAKLLADVVNGMPNDKMLITLDERTQTVKIQCGRNVSNIKGIEADEFPTIPAVADNAVAFDGRRLTGALKRVALCAADDDSRPVLAGVLFRNDGKRMMLAAADGYRLAVEYLSAPGDAFSLIIPANAVETLAKLMGDADDISMANNGSQVAFSNGTGTVLTSRLIDGQFPDVARIIPASHNTRAVVEVAAMAKAVRLASLFAASSQNVLKVTSETSEDTPGRIVVSANAAEVGDNTGEVDALVAGEGGPIAVNAKYLAELLAVAPMAQIAIETQAPTSPFVLKPVGFDGDVVHIIMPMSLAR